MSSLFQENVFGSCVQEVHGDSVIYPLGGCIRVVAEGEVQRIRDVDGASKGEDLDIGSTFETFYLYLSNHRSVRGESKVLVQSDCVLGAGETAHNFTIGIELAQVAGG